MSKNLPRKIQKKTNSRNNFIAIFASKSGGINPPATWGTTEGDVCISSFMCCATYKEEPGVVGSTFDGGWGTRWWWDVENGEWAVSVGEDGNVVVHGDVAGDIGGSEMLNGGSKFSWDDFGVSDEEDTEVGEILSIVGLEDDI